MLCNILSILAACDNSRLKGCCFLLASKIINAPALEDDLLDYAMKSEKIPDNKEDPKEEPIQKAMDNYAHNHTSEQSIPKEILNFLPKEDMEYFQNIEVVFSKNRMEKSNDIVPDRNDPDSVIIKVTNYDIPKESSELEHILKEKLEYIGSGWIGVLLSKPIRDDQFYVDFIDEFNKREFFVPTYSKKSCVQGNIKDRIFNAIKHDYPKYKIKKITVYLYDMLFPKIKLGNVQK